MNTKNKLLQMILGSMIGAIIFSCQKDDEEVVPLFKDLYINDIGLFSAKLYSSFETEQTNFIECGFVVSTDEIHSLEDGIKYAVQPQRGRQMRLTLQELELATEYFVRSYIIQANGGDVKFIEEKRFTTLGLDAVVDTTDLIVSRMDAVGIEFADSINTIADQLEFFLGENKVTSVVVSPTLINVVIPNDIPTDQYKLEIKYKDKLFYIDKNFKILRGKWTKSQSEIPWNHYYSQSLSFISESKIFVVNPIENGEMWKYTIGEDKWEKSKNFIGSRITNGFSISYNDFGYIGGAADGQVSGLFVFDPFINTWALLNDSIILNRRDVISYIKDNKLYFGGGVSTGNSPLPKIDFNSYDLTTEEWSLLASASRINSYRINFISKFNYLYTHSTILLDNKAYVFGGSNYVGGRFQGSTLVMNIIEKDSSFVEISAIPEPCVKPELFSISNKIYVGSWYSSEYYFYEYEPAQNKWTKLSSLRPPGTVYFSHGYNDMGYVGMSDGAGNLTIWEFDPNY